MVKTPDHHGQVRERARHINHAQTRVRHVRCLLAVPVEHVPQLPHRCSLQARVLNHVGHVPHAILVFLDRCHHNYHDGRRLLDPGLGHPRWGGNPASLNVSTKASNHSLRSRSPFIESFDHRSNRSISLSTRQQLSTTTSLYSPQLRSFKHGPDGRSINLCAPRKQSRKVQVPNLRFLAPKRMPWMVFGARNLKCSVFEPFGF